MKTAIHPTYQHDAKIVCACGATYTTGSTLAEMHVDTCSACHPFYTGKQKFLDTAGKLDKFKKRAAKTTAIRAARKTAKAKA
ncbi:MAG: 50S ribosomal protein L31 [Patescibacteria group bacterium]|nr:50S ribosomal protein L31 [Patescibacteria group bacterium]